MELEGRGVMEPRNGGCSVGGQESQRVRGWFRRLLQCRERSLQLLDRLNGQSVSRWERVTPPPPSFSGWIMSLSHSQAHSDSCMHSCIHLCTHLFGLGLERRSLRQEGSYGQSFHRRKASECACAPNAPRHAHPVARPSSRGERNGGGRVLKGLTVL